MPLKASDSTLRANMTAETKVTCNICGELSYFQVLSNSSYSIVTGLGFSVANFALGDPG